MTKRFHRSSQTQRLRRLAQSWRDRATERRRHATPVDTDGKMVLTVTADIYDACAKELDDTLSEKH